MKTDATPIRTSRFRYADRRLLFGRARLFSDRLELSGWQWTGRRRESIPLDNVSRVEWWSSQGGEPNLALHFHDGEVLYLSVEGPGLWKFAIEDQLGRQPASATTPTETLLPVL